MKLPSKPKDLPKNGVYGATLVQIIDLGTQPPPKSQPTWGEARKGNFVFELDGATRKDKKPYLVTAQFTLSSSPKSNLVKALKAWLDIPNDQYDIENALGQNASVTVKISDDGEYANVVNIAGLARGQKVRKPVTPLLSFYLDESFDANTFKELSDYNKEKIMVSPEYKELTAKAPAKAKKKAPAKPAKGR